MALLYKREETENEIIICYKYVCLMYITILAGFVLSFFFKQIAHNIWGVVWIALAAYIIDIWKPNREVKKAMKKGYVKFKGSRFSFSNPLTALIDKQSDNSNERG